MSLPTSIKILRNTSWNIIARLCHIFVNILLIPFIISHVGTTRYGIWVALFAVVNYFSLLEFGTGAATIKYVADYYTQKRIKKVGQVIALTLIFNCIYLPVLIIAYLLSDRVLSFFHIEYKYLAEANFIFIGVLANFAISQIAGVFRSTLIGIQRIHILNLCQMVYLFLYAAGALLLLNIGYGLQGVIILMFCLRCALMLFTVIYVLKMIPSVVKGFSKIDSKMLSIFFGYGLKLQVASLAGFFNFQIDKILIGHYLKVEFVGFYELGAKLAMMVRHIPSVMMGPLIPASAELKTNRDAKRMEELFLRANFYFVLLAAPISAFFVISSHQIVEIWLGEFAHPYCALALQVLSVAFFFQMLSGAVTSIGRGVGMLRYEIEGSVLNAILNISFSIVLIFQFGFLGALLGTTLAMAISNVIYLVRFSRFMNIGLSKIIERILVKPVLCSFTAAVLCYYLNNYLVGSINLSELNRIETSVRLLLIGVVFLFCYVAGLFLTHAVRRADWQLFGKALRAMREF